VVSGCGRSGNSEGSLLMVLRSHIHDQLAIPLQTIFSQPLSGDKEMWYFTWILGLGFALAAGIINVLWLEATYAFGGLDEDKIDERFGAKPQVEQDEPTAQ